MSGLIQFQEVYRDAIQSLMGTNPSGDEIIQAHPNLGRSGIAAAQTGGGTFWDLFAKKGRDEWETARSIVTHYKDQFEGEGIKQSALIRGDFLFTYEPQPYDVVRATIFEYAKMGMNVLQNFHGMNDERALVGVAKAVKEAQAEGYDISAQGTIVIEDNPNITIEGCIEHAQNLVQMGHQEFYLKSASGFVKPEFVRELTAKLCDEFPEQDITVHLHSTYGLAEAGYMAAIEECVARGKKITVDVQHSAMAGSTAHPDMLLMQKYIQNSDIEAVTQNAPQLNIDAIEADSKRLYQLRFLYRQCVSEYQKELLEQMHSARAPGGATGVLRGIPQLEPTMQGVLQTKDWNKIQENIYKMQAKILPDLGHPVQITPFARNTTEAAALAVIAQGGQHDSKKPWYAMLPEGITNYLVGRHGRVPESVNPEVLDFALKKAGLMAPVEFITSIAKADALPDAKTKLQELGISNPTDAQAVSAIIGDPNHVVACHNGTNEPQQPSELPFYAQSPVEDADRQYSRNYPNVPIVDIRDATEAIGGIAKVQEIAEFALTVRQIDDGHNLYLENNSDEKASVREVYVDKINAFLEGVDPALKKAGFTGMQIASMYCKDDNINAVIKEVCDTKGPGMYDFMLRVVEEHKAEKRFSAEVDAKPERPRGAKVAEPAYA